MKKIAQLALMGLLSLATGPAYVQNAGESQHPTLIIQSETVIEVKSIAEQMAEGTFKPAVDKIKEFNPKRWGSNTSVPGKGLPKGNDPLWEAQMRTPLRQGRAPLLSFDAASATATPTDPTGAVGPNHFMNSWNTSFRIWDKAGNALTSAASLSTIFPGTLGDPIVIYDQFADRFLISEFFEDGFDVAVSKGPNPVTSGWWVYRFATNTFPDYPKFSLWSDGYYITANKDQSTAGSSQVVFVLDRSKMLTGNTSATMIGFPLTGIITSGFYSPLAFNANGPTPPPAGNVPVVYMQDDSWSGVSTDHLKIWSINVNWTTPSASTISAPQIINTTAFDGLFDAGSFSNLPQPSGSDIDALQATIMFMAQYRQFSGYNSAVFNFVVDLNGADNKAGIRWYELRQTTHGAPWTIYQEGTYAQPNGHSAFCGNMAIDINGNIGMGYTIVSTTQYPSLRFTGRYASDPLGTMTLTEEVIVNGTQVDPSSRYGDYAQMTVDPVDNATFWSIGEYFSGGRKNRVGVFQIAPPALTAQFSGSPVSICTGGSVTFTDNSLASPTTWTWSFPGGTPSSYSGQTPPPIVYNTAGTYDVTLTVANATGSDSETKTGYITVKSVIADFTGTPTTVVVGNTVTFTDNSQCSPSSWEWSFPGGTPSSYTGQTPPPITYNTIGTYNVALTASKPSGSDTKTRTGYITVSAPIFNMSNATITTCTGDFYDPGGASGNYSNNQSFTMVFLPATAGNKIRMVFSSFSTESGYDYLKIYDGTSTSATLIGSYSGSSSPGTVTASSSNSSGALTFVFTSDVSVVSTGWAAAISCYNPNIPPVADFTATPVNTIIGQTVTFTDISSNTPTSWQWTITPSTFSFTGGTTGTSKNPQVQFSALGQYTVSLTATNAYGSNTKTKTNYINVTNCSVSSFPWTEGFENGGAIPNCWTQEQVNSSGVSWTCLTGNGGSNPAIAHSGSYNACLKDISSADNKTRLITPRLNISAVANPQLKFWHTQAYWYGDQDQLIVYYRTSLTGAWIQLASYTTNIATWTQRTISLPNASAEYYIAFEGNAKYGYGVCVDDVEVSENCTSYSPVSVNITASTNPVCAGTDVSFTAAPVNGGSSPSYQWRLNGTVVTGTTGAVYTHTPTHNDAVNCVLTSNASCISGNPATSNTIAMTVNPVNPVTVSIAASQNPVDAGTPVIFTATPVNGGATPVYQWLVNGLTAGTNAPEFTYIPQDGDSVWCVLTSSVTCPSVNPASSSPVIMSVNALPVTIAVINQEISGNDCFNATQTITVAGNGTSVVIMNGASVTMIAGQNILYYPGTVVEPGAYMLGYIDADGPWCNQRSFAAAGLAAGTGTAEIRGLHVRIFPNPTSGNFMVEIDPSLSGRETTVEVFNMNGKKIASEEMKGQTSRLFSLLDRPSGIYLIRIVSGDVSEAVRIVKL